MGRIQNAAMHGNLLVFEFPVEQQGKEITVAFAGKIDGDKIEGTVSFVSEEGSLDFPWKATRD